VSFSIRKLPAGVRTVSLTLAAAIPIERITRLATNNPPASSRPSPENRATIIHMSDLEDDELPDTEPSAMAGFSQRAQFAQLLVWQKSAYLPCESPSDVLKASLFARSGPLREPFC
jgi:hypothetical protein